MHNRKQLKTMGFSIPRASLWCTFLGVVIFCIITISSYVHIHLLLHFRNYTTISPGTGKDVELLAYVNSNLIVVKQNPDLKLPDIGNQKRHTGFVDADVNPKFSGLDAIPAPAPSPAALSVSSAPRQSSKAPSSTSPLDSVPKKSKPLSVEGKSSKSNVSAKVVSNSNPETIEAAVTEKELQIVNSKSISSNATSSSKTRPDSSGGSPDSAPSKAVSTSSENKKKKPSPAKTKKKKEVESYFVVDGWPQNKSKIATDYVDYNKNTAILKPVDLDFPSEKESPNDPRVVIVIQSAPKNLELRDEVRRTWGSACTLLNWCSYLFILGEVQPDVSSQETQDALESENAEYGDILQERFLDSYNNLTLKTIHILKYFSGPAAETANFLLKTDDDSFVNLAALHDLVKARIEKKSDNLIGYLQLGLKKHHYLPMVHKPTRVHMARKEWHKWLVPSYMYSKKFFPQFLSGSGYLVSKKASRCLLEKSKTIPIVHLEDVYITGLCAAACHIRREHNKGFRARPMSEKTLAKYKVQKTDVVIHYSTGRMDRFFEQVEPSLNLPRMSTLAVNLNNNNSTQN